MEELPRVVCPLCEGNGEIIASSKNIMPILRNIRKSMGIRVWEIANIMGYSRSALSHWERGRTTPTVSIINKYVEALSKFRIENQTSGEET